MSEKEAALAGGTRSRKVTSPVVARALLEEAGVRPSVTRGQNFLVDENVLGVIERAASLSPSDTVVEVGAGLGALTEILIARCGRVFAVEQDSRLMGVLEMRLGGAQNLVLVHGDAVKLDLFSLWPEGEPPRARMVSNLPYRIAATLVVDWLIAYPFLTDYTVMVQREVATRMTSSPGGKDYSAATVKIAYRAQAERVASVSRNSFYPKPRVDSVIVRLRRRGAGESVDVPRARDERHFDLVVTAAFAQRRKKLANSLASHPGLDVDARSVAGALAAVGRDPGARAEELSPADYTRLAELLGEDR